MYRNKFLLLVSIVIVFILLGTGLAAFQWGVASAQEGAVVEPMAVSGKTDALLQYQGRLSNPTTGEAVADGSYTMTLRLYSQSSGGSPLWTEVKDVPVAGGLFSTVLGDVTSLNRNHFDGRALWLGIKVGADAEATPRQQILPVAYALGLAPGPVKVDGDLTVTGELKGAAHYHPDLVTNYEFDDHIYGGMHSNRALAFGSINQFGEVSSATGNVSSEFVKIGDAKYYEITIDGHTYDQRYYVTTVTPILGIANTWHCDGKLCVGIYGLDGEPLKIDFHFVTFQP